MSKGRPRISDNGLASEEWQDEAACQSYPTEMFFEEDDPEAIKAAKTVCRGCPVQTACRTYAMNSKEKYGIWGGLTSAERRNRARAERRALSQKPSSS